MDMEAVVVDAVDGCLELIADEAGGVNNRGAADVHIIPVNIDPAKIVDDVIDTVCNAGAATFGVTESVVDGIDIVGRIDAKGGDLSSVLDDVVSVDDFVRSVADVLGTSD